MDFDDLLVGPPPATNGKRVLSVYLTPDALAISVLAGSEKDETKLGFSWYLKEKNLRSLVI
jgi:hypothetical protein